MRKRKGFLVFSLVLLLLGVAASGCGDTTRLQKELGACESTATKAAEEAIAAVAELDAQLAECEATLAAVGKEVTPTSCPPGPVISCEEAKHCVGEFKTVQGLFHCSYRPDVNGEPTFCNCPIPHPNHDFTALIWGDERQKFIDCLGGEPATLLDKQEFGVYGLIEPYGDKVEIILTGCDQLREK